MVTINNYTRIIENQYFPRQTWTHGSPVICYSSSFYPRRLVLVQGREIGGKEVILPFRKHLPVFRDIFGCHSWEEGATDIKSIKTSDAAEHPVSHRTPPWQSSTPKGQWCWCGEASATPAFMSLWVTVMPHWPHHLASQSATAFGPVILQLFASWRACHGSPVAFVFHIHF